MVRAISFLGASCTGKTSVFDLVKEDKAFESFTKIDSMTRQMVKEGRLEPSFTSIKNQSLIFDKYLELLFTGNYISDRSVIDVHTFTKTIPTSVAQINELDRQFRLIRLNEFYLPTIFYFPIYWEVENDGERMADAERRKKWDKEIRRFLITRRMPYEIMPNDTPFNRLKFMKRVLGTRIKLC